MAEITTRGFLIAALLLAPLLLGSAAGCSNPMVRRVESFRALVEDGDLDAARTHLSDDPRTWYGARDGPGSAWQLGGGRWKPWDEEFNGQSELGRWHVDGQRVFAVAIEDNDYYRAIERKPAPWLLTYFFDDSGLIEGRMVSAVPESMRSDARVEPDRGDAFDAWLRAEYPQEHAYLRPDGQIDPTGDRAARTREKLVEWRREIGLSPPD